MKRRIISLLLCVCMVAGLFTVMGGTAFADDTQTYTVQLGDTLITICQKLGVDYNKNLAWILEKNGLKNANTLPLYKVLTLPAAGKVLTTGGSASSSSGSSYSVPTQTYTLQNGDIVIKVCQKLGVDFYANEAWIKAANKIGSWNTLPVGKVLVLPAAGTKPALSTATPGTAASTTGTTAATTTAATTTTTTAASSSGTSLNLQGGDYVVYYLVNYSVKSGDTLGNICSAYGVDLATVQKLNNISNAAKIYVGQNISIPSGNRPSSGSFTAIVGHRVTSGEIVQTIVARYGLALDANLQNQLKALNNKTNLNKIQVGELFQIPVKGTVTAAASSTGTTGTRTPSGSTTTTQTGTTYYTLNKTGAPNGTYSLTVNGQAVNGAAANQSVHIVATPDHGYKLAGITVTKVYNGEAVPVDSSSNFTMPACDVNINVSFAVDPNASAHSITASSASQMTNLTFVVNGYTNSMAEPGKTVRIVLGALPEGQIVDRVYVTTENGDWATIAALPVEKCVTVNSDFTFTMPAANAFVTVLTKGA